MKVLYGNHFSRNFARGFSQSRNLLIFRNYSDNVNSPKNNSLGKEILDENQIKIGEIYNEKFINSEDCNNFENKVKSDSLESFEEYMKNEEKRISGTFVFKNSLQDDIYNYWLEFMNENDIKKPRKSYNSFDSYKKPKASYIKDYFQNSSESFLSKNSYNLNLKKDLEKFRSDLHTHVFGYIIDKYFSDNEQVLQKLLENKDKNQKINSFNLPSELLDVLSTINKINDAANELIERDQVVSKFNKNKYITQKNTNNEKYFGTRHLVSKSQNESAFFKPGDLIGFDRSAGEKGSPTLGVIVATSGTFGSPIYYVVDSSSMITPISYTKIVFVIKDFYSELKNIFPSVIPFPYDYLNSGSQVSPILFPIVTRIRNFAIRSEQFLPYALERTTLLYQSIAHPKFSTLISLDEATDAIFNEFKFEMPMIYAVFCALSRSSPAFFQYRISHYYDSMRTFGVSSTNVTSIYKKIRTLTNFPDFFRGFESRVKQALSEKNNETSTNNSGKSTVFKSDDELLLNGFKLLLSHNYTGIQPAIASAVSLFLKNLGYDDNESSIVRSNLYDALLRVEALSPLEFYQNLESVPFIRSIKFLKEITPKKAITDKDEEEKYFKSYPRNDMHFDDKIDYCVNRKDFKDLPVYAIDGKDAKEIDDAFSIENSKNDPNCSWVHIHIADPASYIKPGDDVWEYGGTRGSTLYSPVGIVPMLPNFITDLCNLTSYICSNNSKRRTLTFSILFDFEKHELQDFKIQPGLISNIRQFTYDYIDSTGFWTNSPDLKRPPETFENFPKARDQKPLDDNDIISLRKIEVISGYLRKKFLSKGLKFNSNKIVSIKQKKVNLNSKNDSQKNNKLQFRKQSKTGIDMKIESSKPIYGEIIISEPPKAFSHAQEIVSTLMTFCNYYVSLWNLQLETPIPLPYHTQRIDLEDTFEYELLKSPENKPIVLGILAKLSREVSIANNLIELANDIFGTDTPAILSGSKHLLLIEHVDAHRLADIMLYEKWRRIQRDSKALPELKKVADSIVLNGLSTSITSAYPSKHEALGISSYVRVTSPLRRFGDLLAHKQIQLGLNKDFYDSNNDYVLEEENDKLYLEKSKGPIPFETFEKLINDNYMREKFRASLSREIVTFYKIKKLEEDYKKYGMKYLKCIIIELPTLDNTVENDLECLAYCPHYDLSVNVKVTSRNSHLFKVGNWITPTSLLKAAAVDLKVYLHLKAK